MTVKMEPLLKPSEPKKITPKTLISSYYKPTRKRPSEQPFVEPAIKYVQDERSRNNEDQKDLLLLQKLSKEYNDFLNQTKINFEREIYESSRKSIHQEERQPSRPDRQKDQ